MPRLISGALLLVLTACSDVPEGDGTSTTASASLVGLYIRSGAGEVPDRLCISEKSGTARFGLITEGRGAGNCTAKGRVLVGSSALKLVIDGAPACTMQAARTAAGLSLTSVVGEECTYYCGARETIGEGEFSRYGKSEADAANVFDVAGEPLCA